MANKPTQPLFQMGLETSEQSVMKGILNTELIEHGPGAEMTVPEGNVTTGVPSQVRYNPETDSFEGYYTNGGWLPMGGGGIRWELLPHASTATLDEGRGYLIDNTTGSSTVVFPIPTRIGDSVTVCDMYGKFSVYPLTIDPNGKAVYGSTEPMTLSTDSVSATFTWSGDARGWIITAGVGLGQGRVYSRTIYTNVLTSETSQVTLATQPSIVDVYADGKRLLESKYSLDGYNVDFSPSLPTGTELQVIQYVPIQLGTGGGGSGGSTVITWIYNGGAAAGGETTITLDIAADEVTEIFINGTRQQKSLGFTYDTTSKLITLAEELDAGDEVVVVINGDPTLYNQIDRTPNEVARSTNVPVTQVIMTSDTITKLDGKTVIYDVNAQKIWGLPSGIPTGASIVSVSAGVLTYNPGNVAVNLVSAPNSAAYLSDVLAKKDGVSLIGVLGSVAEFAGINTYAGKRVYLKSWYAGSLEGGGYFYFDSTIAKSKHDGGKYISPTVPYTTAQAFVSGTGETDSAGTGVWVRGGVGTGLRGEWYGMANGVEVSAIVNKMGVTAGTEGLGLDFPIGTFVVTSSINLYCDGSATGKIAYIRGASSRGTIFRADASVLTTYTMAVYGSIGTAAATHDMVTISGIWFSSNGTLANGNIYKCAGLYLQNILQFDLYDVHTKFLERGLIVQNSLYGNAVSCRFDNHREAVLMRKNGLTTGGNAIEFTRCDFSGNTQYCVHGTESHAVKFNTCTFEGNGGKLDSTGALIVGVACVQFDTTGAAGGIGAVFVDCYFEGNAILDVKFLCSLDYSQLLSIKNCIFNKTRSDMTAGRIQVVNTRTGMSTGRKITLELVGNRFYSGTNNADALYADVEFTGVTQLGYGHAELLDYDNVYSANTPIDKDHYVVWKKAPDDGFICRGLSAGGMTSTSSRNIASVTRQSTGVYRVITNQLTSLFTYQIQLDNAGFGLISTSENNEAFTITTYDQTGAAADRNFRVLAKLV